MADTSSHEPAADTLRRSPLHGAHADAGARFAPFGGWAMPVEYAAGGVLAEHAAVRERIGLFDVSHLGTVLVHGPGALGHVDRVLSNSLQRLVDGQAQYTLCLDPDGRIVDDLIVYRVSADDLVLVPNAANAAAVVAALRVDLPEGVQVLDVHEEVAVVAVQGPRVEAVMASAGLPHGHEYMSFVVVEEAVEPVATGAGRTVVCRTGYTGERGYEVLVPAAGALRLWQRLLAAVVSHGGMPAGLGARDTLRTEMGYPLHGNDIGGDVTPVQAGLGFAVGWKKPAFVGRDVVLAEKAAGPARRASGLLAVGRGVPRAGMGVHLLDGDGLGRRVGTTTSGTFSPTLRTGIALALLDADSQLGPDDEVAVDVRGRPLRCRVARAPFVPSHVRG